MKAMSDNTCYIINWSLYFHLASRFINAKMKNNLKTHYVFSLLYFRILVKCTSFLNLANIHNFCHLIYAILIYVLELVYKLASYKRVFSKQRGPRCRAATWWRKISSVLMARPHAAPPRPVSLRLVTARQRTQRSQVKQISEKNLMRCHSDFSLFY